MYPRIAGRAISGRGTEISTSGYGTVFSLWFAPHAPAVYEAAAALADGNRTMALHLRLRAEGVLTMPSPWGRIHTSFAHDEAAWDALALAFRTASRS